MYNGRGFRAQNAKKAERKGILNAIKAYIDRNKLGELLLLGGYIHAHQLKEALREHKQTAAPLGQILIRNNIITRRDLVLILARQKALRFLAGAMMCFMSLGFSAKKVRAEQIVDVSSIVSVSFEIENSSKIGQISTYPSLFGTQEQQSLKLDAFTKWSGMFERFEKELRTAKGQAAAQDLRERLSLYGQLPLPEMAKKVNAMMNEKAYIVDKKNWGKSDYWATPIEFMARGGDCEDFAIAKYAALRALGVSESRLRLAIVHDEEKNIPHAVLVVYTDDEPLILDNQIKSVRSAVSISHYRPIFSINREAWWLHTTPKATVLASAK